MQSVNDLKARNCIVGELPSVDELLEPAEERDMGEFSAFEGGDKAIADEVRREIAITNDLLDLCRRIGTSPASDKVELVFLLPFWGFSSSACSRTAPRVTTLGHLPAVSLPHVPHFQFPR
ncbi:hypothetical protein K503DRAFT_769445 [Rhizopogon vinicolor AM-OR11-026]|uniref:Uncharacterized protein n=1 Tax=Rhizopogon vinicolor AM-OR11-026 TaxID=1314800 RepID=A0A1B7N3S0_9AGAM|nr:hypothetical protein K503DRAFT_769445 [Rhizopogon vinicolor AM-OR11-026]